MKKSSLGLVSNNFVFVITDISGLRVQKSFSGMAEGERRAQVGAVHIECTGQVR